MFSQKSVRRFVHWALYIWRKHANLSSVKQLKPKTWRIFWRNWRHLTPYLWQRLMVATASQAQFWARYSFYTPWIFSKFFSIFSNFSFFWWRRTIFMNFFTLLRFVQKCTSSTLYPWARKLKQTRKNLEIMANTIFFCDRKWGPKINSMWSRYLNITAWFFHVFHFFTFYLSSHQIFKLYDWI